MTYSAEPTPPSDIKDLLDTQWSTFSGNIPEPTFIEVNADGSALNIDIANQGDAVIIRLDTNGYQENVIGTWYYTNRTYRVLLEIVSAVSRQRLMDLMQEIRRICYDNMHSMTNYQRIQFVNFTEQTQKEFNIWRGFVTISLVNSAIRIRSGDT